MSMSTWRGDNAYGVMTTKWQDIKQKQPPTVRSRVLLMRARAG